MSLTSKRCDRCHDRICVTIMSKFNTDTLCLPCKADERRAPGYQDACRAEIDAVRRGALNFAGVGLAVGDAAFLAGQRTLRTES
jgi:hypothetical protein